MSDLTGAQKASLIDALLSGYTSDDQLAELLDLRLDVKLPEIAQEGTLREQIFAVVTWAEAHGRTKELALQAQAWRPRNAALATVVDALYPGERKQPPADAGSATTSQPRGLGAFESASGEGAADSSRPDRDARRGQRAASNQRTLIYGAVAVAAILLVVFAIVLRPWRGADDGGGDGGRGNGRGNGAGKDGPRLPATLRFISLSGAETGQKPARVVIEARFQQPQLSPGAVLWFVVGSGLGCNARAHRAQVDNPSLGYMTSIIADTRENITCAQLLAEDANGQTIARSDPRDISY